MNHSEYRDYLVLTRKVKSECKETESKEIKPQVNLFLNVQKKIITFYFFTMNIMNIMSTELDNSEPKDLLG